MSHSPDDSTIVRDDYGQIAKLLHWIVAGAIVLQFTLANLADDAESRFREFVLLANHKSVGVTILALACLRFGWRLTHRPPAPVAMPRWQRVASGISHWSLYALLLLMPITGWLMSSASNVSVSWFNLVQLPDFVAADERLAAVFEDIHETLATVLFALATLHVSAALKHRFVNRDRVMQRMSSPAGLVLFVLIIVLGVAFLVPETRASEPAERWSIDHAQSHIRFEAEQAGATFTGAWTDWSAELRFDPRQPEVGSFDVEIRIAGVRTGDSERDETLADPEFFDAEAHPVARYRADSFRVEDDGRFVAVGKLHVKGEAHDVNLDFTVETNGDRRILEGRTRLDRLELGIGTGEWSDTAWIGQFVDVDVRVVATVGED